MKNKLNLSAADRRKVLAERLALAPEQAAAEIMMKKSGTEGVMAARAFAQNKRLFSKNAEEMRLEAAHPLKKPLPKYFLIMRLWILYQIIKFSLKHQRQCIQKSNLKGKHKNTRSRFIP